VDGGGGGGGGGVGDGMDVMVGDGATETAEVIDSTTVAVGIVAAMGTPIGATGVWPKKYISASLT